MDIQDGRGRNQTSRTNGQDFRTVFGLGEDEKHLATMDTSGVALAAIQGLNEKLSHEIETRDARIQKLEAELAEVKQMLPK
jgi:hypothetical protein